MEQSVGGRWENFQGTLRYSGVFEFSVEGEWGSEKKKVCYKSLKIPSPNIPPGVLRTKI